MRNRIMASLLVLSMALPGTAALAEDSAAENSAVNDPSVIQQRVTGTCSIGSFITAIAEDGTVTLTYRPVHTWTLTDEVDYIEPKARVY